MPIKRLKLDVLDQDQMYSIRIKQLTASRTPGCSFYLRDR
jgi:hypothetical protein